MKFYSISNQQERNLFVPELLRNCHKLCNMLSVVVEQWYSCFIFGIPRIYTSIQRSAKMKKEGSCFPKSLQTNAWEYLKLGHNSFDPHPFQ
jgi:hypothetical protein